MIDENKFTDEYVLGEIQKLRYAYGLNKVIRYDLKRDEKFQTQSVAEHLTNMMFLAHYFRELEDPEKKLNFERVIKIILFHDLGEIETGDIITVVKNEVHEDTERLAIKTVKEKTSAFVSSVIEEIYNEFESPKTSEGKFAKAIDKFEGQLLWVEKEGVEMVRHVLQKNKLELHVEQPKIFRKNDEMMKEYNFPFIRRFLEVINKKKEETGLYIF